MAVGIHVKTSNGLVNVFKDTTQKEVETATSNISSLKNDLNSIESRLNSIGSNVTSTKIATVGSTASNTGFKAGSSDLSSIFQQNAFEGVSLSQGSGNVVTNIATGKSGKTMTVTSTRTTKVTAVKVNTNNLASGIGHGGRIVTGFGTAVVSGNNLHIATNTNPVAWCTHCSFCTAHCSHCTFCSYCTYNTGWNGRCNCGNDCTTYNCDNHCGDN